MTDKISQGWKSWEKDIPVTIREGCISVSVDGVKHLDVKKFLGTEAGRKRIQEIRDEIAVSEDRQRALDGKRVQDAVAYLTSEEMDWDSLALKDAYVLGIKDMAELLGTEVIESAAFTGRGA